MRVYGYISSLIAQKSLEKSNLIACLFLGNANPILALTYYKDLKLKPPDHLLDSIFEIKSSSLSLEN